MTIVFTIRFCHASCARKRCLWNSMGIFSIHRANLSEVYDFPDSCTCLGGTGMWQLTGCHSNQFSCGQKNALLSVWAHSDTTLSPVLRACTTWYSVTYFHYPICLASCHQCGYSTLFTRQLEEAGCAVRDHGFLPSAAIEAVSFCSQFPTTLLSWSGVIIVPREVTSAP